MNIFGPRHEGEVAPDETYPPARRSLQAIRTLVDTEKLRGTMAITREDWIWKIKATFHAAVDYEIEISGTSLDEVAFTTLDALQQMLP